VPDRASDVSRRHRMKMDLITGQADAVVDEIATGKFDIRGVIRTYPIGNMTPNLIWRHSSPLDDA
jgi:hypothetical protein